MVNFSAGPAMLPIEVLREAKEALIDWQGLGLSVVEVSHRSPEFEALGESARVLFRELLSLPDDYEVLLLHGGAQAQFSAIPLNFTTGYSQAIYVNTGTWSKKAGDEAERYVSVNWQEGVASAYPVPDDAAYLYYADNETIQGIEFPTVPENSTVPLIADMSSNLLSRPFDINQFGCVFACAQKNLGISGVTVVIVHRELLQRERLAHTPKVFNYALQAKNQSMVNTPNTFAWYMLERVLQWVKREGGLSVMHDRAVQRSSLIYDFIDQSDYYQNPVNPKHRSRMNVVFTLADENHDAEFLSLAKAAGLVNLKGHRSVGGIRASVYNAMPLEGVQALINFMADFERSRR